MLKFLFKNYKKSYNVKISKILKFENPWGHDAYEPSLT